MEGGRGDNQDKTSSPKKIAPPRLERRISLKDIKTDEIRRKDNEDMSWNPVAASARGEDSDAPYISDAY